MPKAFAFATWAGLSSLSADDRLAADEVVRRGHTVTPAVWDDPSVPWSSFDAVVIRSTWNYFRKYSEFLEWVHRCARATHLWNRERTVEWNTDKSYLFDLARHGVRVIPSERARAGESLDELCRRRGWDTVVVKPVVSAAAEGARYVPRDGRSAFEPVYSAALSAAEQLVQPFVPGVLDPGERSLVYLAGRFSHAFTKGPALPVDRRESAGLRSIEPTPADLALAEKALSFVDAPPLYARVDLVPEGEAPMLMELELVEPYLHFVDSPAARARFADALETAAV